MKSFSVLSKTRGNGSAAVVRSPLGGTGGGDKQELHSHCREVNPHYQSPGAFGEDLPPRH